MKSLLRIYIFHLIALFLTTELLGGSFTIEKKLEIWLMAATVLALLNVLVKPILNLRFLPIRALTLGLFSLVINAGVFYVFIKLTPQVSITAWRFPGFSLQNFTISAYELPMWGTLLVASLLVSIITNFFAYLVE